ncbi:hypothetical protein Rt10032_c02g0884 [Rhodotorula toruloides]|uniref:Uncharacterized protein n=1 Tax=Rhodotorula toruloides TaxID=5286 RepID=A0A511K937_RHOTO|nr:hypothetical protein Rt10032_c02g0884 [Rhodotorula toruloides]
MSGPPQTDFQRLKGMLATLRTCNPTDGRLAAFAEFVAQAISSEPLIPILMPAARERIFSAVHATYASAAAVNGVPSSKLHKPSSYVPGHSANEAKLRNLLSQFNRLKEQLVGAHALSLPSASCRFEHRQGRIYGLTQNELRRAWL